MSALIVLGLAVALAATGVTLVAAAVCLAGVRRIRIRQARLDATVRDLTRRVTQMECAVPAIPRRGE